MKTKAIESFQKVINTIKSVKTEEQLYATERMVNNFFILFNTDINLSYFDKIMKTIDDKMENLNFEPFYKEVVYQDLKHTFFKLNPNPEK